MNYLLFRPGKVKLASDLLTKVGKTHLTICGLSPIISESERGASMKSKYRQADGKGRITIPELANATLIIDKIDDTEFRIKKAKVIAEKDLEFHEESFPVPLSERDAVWFLGLLESPPSPNRAALDAAQEFMKNNDQVEN